MIDVAWNVGVFHCSRAGISFIILAIFWQFFCHQLPATWKCFQVTKQFIPIKIYTLIYIYTCVYMLYHPYNNISLDDSVVRDATVTLVVPQVSHGCSAEAIGSPAWLASAGKGWPQGMTLETINMKLPKSCSFSDMVCCCCIMSNPLYFWHIYIYIYILSFLTVLFFFQYVFPRVLFPCVYTKSLLVIFSTATHPMIFFGSFFIPLGSNPSLMVPLKYDPPIGCAS